MYRPPGCDRREKERERDWSCPRVFFSFSRLGKVIFRRRDVERARERVWMSAKRTRANDVGATRGEERRIRCERGLNVERRRRRVLEKGREWTKRRKKCGGEKHLIESRVVYPSTEGDFIERRTKWERWRERKCVCVTERERERERENVCMCACGRWSERKLWTERRKEKRDVHDAINTNVEPEGRRSKNPGKSKDGETRGREKRGRKTRDWLYVIPPAPVEKNSFRFRGVCVCRCPD